MDGIIVLMGLVILAIPVSIIALFVGQSNLKSRLSVLERVVREQRAALQDRAMPAAAVPVEAPSVEVAPAAAVEVPQGPQTVAPWQIAASDAPDLAAKAMAVSGASARPDQDQPLVIRADRVGALLRWLRENWVYAVSALSLALAGVFFVQYGVEKGLLPPGLRVLAAIGFGACLIAAGEWLRRKHGDSVEYTTAYLPSVFAGAGLVSMFAAVLAARQMYGLIGPEAAFAGHLATAILAVGLGWFYGPLLVAVGLLGAAAAPFIVAGGSAPAAWLYGYYGLIAGVGLAVDAVRRWAWVSVLALVLGYGGGALMYQGGAGAAGWIGLAVVLAIGAVILPLLSFVPRHQGPFVLQSLVTQRKIGWPPFPVRLAAGAAVASTFALMLLADRPLAEAMLAMGALTLLALAYLLWADRAEGLTDLAALPALGFVGAMVMQGLGFMPIMRDFAGQAIASRPPETAAPMTVTILLAMAVAVSAAAALRSLRMGPWRVGFGLAAVLVAPVSAAVLELFWLPGPVLGIYVWSLHIMGLAAGMVALALRYAGLDGADRRRVAHATLSALSLIALALFLLTTKTALTLALAVLALVAAGLDRRFRLPEMGWFIQVAVAVLGYRLLADPGLDWAMSVPLGQVILAFGGVIVALLAALWQLPVERVLPKGVLESAVAGFAAVLANVLISRWLLPDSADATDYLASHWGFALNAMPWLILMLMQVYRARLGGVLRRLRQAIAVVAGGLAAVPLAVAAGPFNPLFSAYPDDRGGLVRGPMVLDTLLLAYGVPGLVLLLAAWALPGLQRIVKVGFAGVGTALLALYAGLEIRRFWQGDWLGAPGVEQGELYTYTLALMLLGAALLYQAIVRRSGRLRRVAMAVIGLTIAKVFLLDAAGLTGLTRVVSFLGLGLSLAGLAWLNRWAGEAVQKPSDAP